MLWDTALEGHCGWLKHLFFLIRKYPCLFVFYCKCKKSLLTEVQRQKRSDRWSIYFLLQSVPLLALLLLPYVKDGSSCLPSATLIGVCWRKKMYSILRMMRYVKEKPHKHHINTIWRRLIICTILWFLYCRKPFILYCRSFIILCREERKWPVHLTTAIVRGPNTLCLIFVHGLSCIASISLLQPATDHAGSAGVAMKLPFGGR